LKITIEESKDIEETEIHIKCSAITEDLSKIIAAISLYDNIVVGVIDNTSYMIKAADIFYFETIDNRVFIYTEDKTYETMLKIYEIEEKFKSTSFVRISKSAVVNLRKISSIQRKPYSKLIAELINGEKIIISRHYMPDIAAKLGI